MVYKLVLTALLLVAMGALPVRGEADSSASPRVGLPSLQLSLTAGTSSASAPARASRLVVEPGAHHFGEVPVGATAAHTFTLVNDGTDLIVGTAECVGPFQVVSGSPYLLRPGEVGRLQVRFAPRGPGVHTGLIQFRGEYGGLSILAGTANTVYRASQAMPVAGPTQPSLVEIRALGGGTSFRIRWQASSAAASQVWVSDDLSHWEAVGSAVVAGGSEAVFVDDGSQIQPPPVVVGGRFYRLGEAGGDIVGFLRVRLAPKDTPLSVPFLRAIAARGTISGLASRSVSDEGADFRPGQFRFEPSRQPQTFVLALASGLHAGRWFLIRDNDARTIHLNDADGTLDLTRWATVGDRYLIYPLWSIAEVFGAADGSVLKAGDQILLWDVGTQTYEPPIGWGKDADGVMRWMQEGKAMDAAPLFPGEGLVVSRTGRPGVELVLTGVVSPLPLVQEIAPGNNLVGSGQPVGMLVAETDLVESGFAGAALFSRADKLYLYHPRRENFRTALWYNNVLGRWLSPLGGTDAAREKLPAASAFFLQRNQSLGFEWIQRPHPPQP